MLYAIIMAGGSGTRFWPASRRDFPKQLLAFDGQRSMLQSTVSRLDGLCQPNQILILTNQRLVEATRKQLPQLPASSIVGEPCKRDTAPCIGLGATLVDHRESGGTMLVMPADHAIEQTNEFHASIKRGLQLLDEDPTRIITFGIRPSYPAEVFGYIESDQELSASAFSVKQFREKPDRQTAEQFLADNRFFWNAGIFLWRTSTILDALQTFEPEMAGRIETIKSALGSDSYEDVVSREFAAIRGKSIDYAVLERYDNVCVVEASFDWNDVGNWTAIPRVAGTDIFGNSVTGKHLNINTSGSVIRSTQDHLVVTLGMKDCIVVHTPDATLVADKKDESAVREVVQKLEELGWEDYL